jgi:uncharacterized protein (DUF342 family)
MDIFADQLVQYGSLGLFCLFLVVQYFQQGKKIDLIQASFQDTLQKISENHKSEEENIRTRYDSVIEDYRSRLEAQKDQYLADKSELQHEIKTSLNDLDKRLILIANTLTKLLNEIQQQRTEAQIQAAQDGRTRNIVR